MMAAGGGDGGAAMVKMVDMPVEYLRWVLAQDKEDYRVPTLEDYTREEIAESGAEAILGVIGSLQTAYDEFPEFLAWVLGVLGEDGRVMVREDMLSSDPDEWQEIVDREWAEARQELVDVDGETTTTTAGPPLGTHTYLLSTYLSMLYQYAAPVRRFGESRYRVKRSIGQYAHVNDGKEDPKRRKVIRNPNHQLTFA